MWDGIQTRKCGLHFGWKWCPESRRETVSPCSTSSSTCNCLAILFTLLSLLFRNKSYTLPFENRKNITHVALSPDSNVLLTVDEGAFINLRLCVKLIFSLRWQSSPIEFQKENSLASFQLQETRQRHKILSQWQVSCTKRRAGVRLTSDSLSDISPSRTIHMFKYGTLLTISYANSPPFNLHRTYTGHHDEVLSIEWSPDSRCVVLFLRSTTSIHLPAQLFPYRFPRYDRSTIHLGPGGRISTKDVRRSQGCSHCCIFF